MDFYMATTSGNAGDDPQKIILAWSSLSYRMSREIMKHLEYVSEYSFRYITLDELHNPIIAGVGYIEHKAIILTIPDEAEALVFRLGFVNLKYSVLSNDKINWWRPSR